MFLILIASATAFAALVVMTLGRAVARLRRHALNRWRDVELLLGEVRYVAGSEVHRLLADLPSGNHPLLRRLARVGLPWSGPLTRAAEARRLETNEEFIERELGRHQSVFDDGGDYPLTAAQRRAVVHNDDVQLVLAGAGSGKTATVVAKVDYLVRSGITTANKIRVVAFNAKARDEVRERLEARSLGGVTVQTFHGLGYDVLGQSTGFKPPVSALATDDRKRVEALHEFLLDAMTSEGLAALVIVYLSSYLRPITSENAASRGTTPEERASELPRTWSGEKVKSHGEWAIANLLFRYGVDFEYEAPYGTPTSDGVFRQYQPDFHLTGTNIYIEYLGLARDGSTAANVNEKEYHASLAWKQKLHAEHGTTLIELFSYQLWEGSLPDDLVSALKRHDVELRPRSIEDVLAQIEPTYVNELTRLLDSFLQVFRAQGGSLDEIRGRVAALRAPHRRRAEVFVDVFNEVHQRYEQHHEQRRQIDFHAMINQAAELLEQSGGLGNSHVVVDEFQDISGARMRLLRAAIGDVARVVAVGDDWQSIYRFTGSDVGVIQELPKHLGPIVRTDIPDVFRFDQRLADLSRKFVMQDEAQIDKEIRARPPKENRPVVEVRRSEPADRNADVTEIAVNVADGDPAASVLVLGRYHHELESIRVIDPRCSGLTITKSTVHAAKGREADYVIVVGVDDGLYGFPSRIEDDPLLDLALPTASALPFAEERRLFYVALTRARERVFVLSDPSAPSPFAIELGEEVYRRFVRSELRGPGRRCPECGSTLRKRSGPSGTFYGCSSYPFCTHTSPGCDDCDGFVQPPGVENSPRCDECGKDYRTCAQCGQGFLVPRSGKNGEFFGCSRWKPNGMGCRYTEGAQPKAPAPRTQQTERGPARGSAGRRPARRRRRR